MKIEIWKDIKGYEGLYQVSNLGRVKSLNYNHTGKEQILKQHVTGEHRNYLNVPLCKNGVVRKIRVHILVAKHFVYNDDPINKNQVHHKDKNTFNNYVNNLEWVSHKKHNEIDRGKPVDCFDLSGNFVKHYSSIRATDKDNHCSTCVMRCCQNKPKHHTHHGYIWKFSETN